MKARQAGLCLHGPDLTLWRLLHGPQGFIFTFFFFFFVARTAGRSGSGSSTHTGDTHVKFRVTGSMSFHSNDSLAMNKTRPSVAKKKRFSMFLLL